MGVSLFLTVHLYPCPGSFSTFSANTLLFFSSRIHYLTSGSRCQAGAGLCSRQLVRAANRNCSCDSALAPASSNCAAWRASSSVVACVGSSPVSQYTVPRLSFEVLSHSFTTLNHSLHTYNHLFYSRDVSHI